MALRDEPAPVRLAETLGAKLRRLARDAERGNPTSNLPWKAPPAYAQGEAIKTGNVRASGGNWYEALSTATTAGASGPTHTVANPAFDGAGSTGVLWSWIGAARMAADDAAAPTVSVEAYGSPSLGLLYQPVSHPSRFRMLGATPEVYSTTQWKPAVFQSKSGTTVYGASSGIEFMVFDSAFAIDHVAFAQGMTFIVDGRFVSLDHDGVPASSQWLKMALPGGMREHRVEVRGRRDDWNFRGVRVSTLGQVYAPPATDLVRAVFIEDSIGAGSNYGPYMVGQTLHRQFGDLVGIRDMWSFSKGGTGYIAKDVDGASYSYAERLAQAVALKPDIVFFAGSSNDRGTRAGTPFASTPITAADLTAAALSTYRTLRGLGYAGPIVSFGIVPIDDSAEVAAAKIAYAEQAVADAVTAFADPQCWFVPVRTDPVGPWVTGAWNNDATPSSANSALVTNIDPADKTHPGAFGVSYYAQRRATAFKRSVLPNIR